MSLFSKFLRSLGLTVQPIDYNSSILAALLSGINLACLELRKKQDGGPSRQSCFCRLVVFGAGSFFLFKAQKRHFQQKLAVELPLSTVSPHPGQTARLAAVTKCPSDVDKQIQSSVSVIDLAPRAPAATIFLSLID